MNLTNNMGRYREIGAVLLFAGGCQTPAQQNGHRGIWWPLAKFILANDERPEDLTT